MRNGNEEIRNGNEEIRNRKEEMRLSMGKIVHASQKLAHCIDLSREIMAALIHCNLTVHTDSEPYDGFETEVD